MSKTKTKRAHRELKRDKARKLAAHHRKATSAAKLPSTLPPPSKKQKPNPTAAITPMQSASKPHTQASQKHEIPFGVYDNILLVGEGDFSFTHSLCIAHGCANVVATSYDTEEEVRRKYPSFESIEEELRELTPPVPLHFGIDAQKLGGYKALRRRGGEEEEEGEGWDTIAFMFPHTGGLSTDVNRQVRANQALLVGFFKACLEAVEKKDKPRTPGKGQSDEKEPKIKGDIKPSPVELSPPKKHKPPPAPLLASTGKILITLFEGSPYTLWNIRDLARHAGLRVLESFKFDFADYPGYHHVRTLGAIEGGGGWKGEDRPARMYVFGRADVEVGQGQKQRGKGKKRRREGSGSESEEG
jgi:25S rRNA (uracil2634-N3)-methyltransferase